MVQRGEIYWVDLGVTKAGEQAGSRPVLIVQNDTGNMTSPTTIVAAITSKKKKAYPFHVHITADESGLPQDSTILLEQLRTFNQSRVTSKLGRLSDTKMAEVDKALKLSLGIS